MYCNRDFKSNRLIWNKSDKSGIIIRNSLIFLNIYDLVYHWINYTTDNNNVNTTFRQCDNSAHLLCKTLGAVVKWRFERKRLHTVITMMMMMMTQSDRREDDTMQFQAIYPTYTDFDFLKHTYCIKVEKQAH